MHGAALYEVIGAAVAAGIVIGFVIPRGSAPEARPDDGGYSPRCVMDGCRRAVPCDDCPPDCPMHGSTS